MFKKIADKIWKFTGTDQVNTYFLDFEKKTMIDCGNRADRQFIERDLKYMIDPSDIETVILTHLHYDHIGNFDMFSKAKFYASKEEIEDFEKNKLATVFNEEIISRFTVQLNQLPEMLNSLQVISVPGHTRGSIALWHEPTKTLFTGDTLFPKGIFGRSDLPTSAPEEMKQSLNKLDKYKFKVLAPGHDY